jgi:hypothetical protein
MSGAGSALEIDQADSTHEKTDPDTDSDPDPDERRNYFGRHPVRAEVRIHILFLDFQFRISNFESIPMPLEMGFATGL